MADTPNRLLTRVEAAQFLQVHGYPVAARTLATMVTRGGGPRFRRFGARALYRAEDLITWAEARCTPPRRSSAEADGERAERGGGGRPWLTPSRRAAAL